ncbi:Chemotaxis protein methyltransferase CheR [Enhygromyxa salina]|uniref:protein-glutamate O-methyltransferase n=1 Tax=Enhygromyxa salina TaxID=215803 RepID=A0A0C1ZZU7_9BACT|nr:CheR family methyltransferase [Enhygromyxa salina]KIG16678.1 Chemotaxis protein methyltransferase CheR [Enhygromyxa salina]
MQDQASDTNEAQPEPRAGNFMVAGLGASAGGLQALTAFFENLPTDSGLAFVVITHQHAGHVSLMPEILGKHTTLPVVEATDGMLVEPNHVYLSPPGGRLALMGGTLHDMRSVSGNNSSAPVLPIDYFFRSLAEELGDRALAVVLSGTGSDGSVGAKIIKRETGLVLAEDPNSATYDGMPRSVIATSVVDFIGTPAEIARKIVNYAARTTSGQPRQNSDVSLQDIRKILVMVRDHTGHDFSGYKENTIRRRIERRMNLHQFESPRDYVAYLQQNPIEFDILFKELLIGVTNFFRDPEAFATLADKLPELLEHKRDGDSVRVWVAGCSTGEEAYSIAILLHEATRELNKRLVLQIFATDLDATAIDRARAGIYPEGIAVDVGEPRLGRYFAKDEAAYRVRKEIRDMVIFAPHNVIADPPFTKLDLLSCRNLLIYLNSQLQRRIVGLFHYALRPGGLMFLGTSESVGNFADLFTSVDKRTKLFRRVSTSPNLLPRFPLAASAHADLTTREHRELPRKPTAAPVARLVEKVLIAEHVPPSVVVNERGTIIHIHGRIGQYFEPAPGQPSLNLLDMAREGLQPSLATCLRQAASRDAEVRHDHVRVRSNGTFSHVDVSARRLTDPQQLQGLILFTFVPCPPPEQLAALEVERPSGADNTNQLQAVENELRYTKETLRSTIEELETSNEELKSANEELQSTNEELQSTNEEIETSKEEMQSLNEELHTVNSELEEKVADLSQANDDMTNLLNSTEIATVFLDNDLRIKRFTASATRIIKLIWSDVGRPIGDLASELHYESLVADATAVARTLIRLERELQGKNGNWYLMRMVPYRTTDNVIDGLVMTFVDITDQKRAFAELQRIEDQIRRDDESMAVVLTACSVPVVFWRVDRELRFCWVGNPFPGLSATQMVGKRIDELAAGEGASRLLELERRVLATGVGEEQDLLLEINDASNIWRVCAHPQRDEDGEVECVSAMAVAVRQLD